MSFHHSSRNNFVSPPSIFDRILAGLPSGLAVYLQNLWQRQNYDYNSLLASINGRQFPRTWKQLQQQLSARSLKRLIFLPNVFLLIWYLLLLWGERWVFESSIKACDWESWERWPKAATPHRLILLADPQIIDPHTYPGRPWPLSTFTYLHTDNYMAHSYIQLSKILSPDTIFFLGDLFDGARDWKTRVGESADPIWAENQRPKAEANQYKYWRKHYGEAFWLKEYDRFGRIFFKHWNDGSSKAGKGQRGKKIIASLPGNHDLGFGPLVKIPVRNRFETYFGETNRVDVIGNHTFVSVDGLSLSAKEDERGTPEIYGPVEEFLKNLPSTKRKAVNRELRWLGGRSEELIQRHIVEDLHHADFTFLPTMDPGPGPGAPDFPTILLTHVPLYRKPGTPCGPNREHWPPATPPAGQTTPVNPDERNAISISRGWQYQNVLGEADSIRLVKDVGNVISVFSGDDHDYCELNHGPDKENVKEITVKSMSYAMGVRKPGFLMVSMWNPVDSTGASLSKDAKSPTIETHLCILPDQISILIKYLFLICTTIIILIIRAILVPILKLQQFSPHNLTSPYAAISTTDGSYPLLPTSNKDTSNSAYREEPQQFSSRTSNSSTSSTSSNGHQLLAPRSTANRTRSVSPGPGYGYGIPPSQSLFQSQGQARTPPPASSGNFAPAYGNGSGNGLLDYGGGAAGKRNDDYDAGDEEAEWGRERARGRRTSRELTKAEVVFREAWTSIWRVTWVVSLLYLWAVWRW